MKEAHPSNQSKRLLTTKELAEYLKLNQITIRKWTCQKQIPHFKIGKSVRFDLDTINAWLQEQQQNVAKWAA